MRRSSLAMAVSAAAILGWSSVGVAAAAPPPPPPPPLPKCADLGGVVDPAQICQIRATDAGYTMSLAYPVDYPDVQAVFDYVKQTRDGFLNVAKMPDARTQPYELETTETEFDSTAPPRATRSVVFKTYQGVGGAHPTTFYKSFTWDQGLRKPITIDDLFREGTDPYPILLPLVQGEINRQLGQLVFISPGDGLDPTKYQNFAVTNDALIFFFGQGDLLPESAGALQVSVPRGPVDFMIA